MAQDDTASVALLHMDGANLSTTFTDESGKSWTAAGGAKISTAVSKFGGACGAFSTNDYISVADSSDWILDGGSNNNKWTIDLWAYLANDPGTGTVGIMQQYVDNSNFWSLQITNNLLEFQVRSGGSNTVVIDQTFNPAATTWYHLAIVKNGAAGYKHFIDGTQVGSTTTDTSTIPDLAGALYIGRQISGSGTTSYWDGYFDEVRISKGIARWVDNFTPPTYAYGFYGQALISRRFGVPV